MAAIAKGSPKGNIINCNNPICNMLVFSADV